MIASGLLLDLGNRHAKVAPLEEGIVGSVELYRSDDVEALVRRLAAEQGTIWATSANPTLEAALLAEFTDHRLQRFGHDFTCPLTVESEGTGEDRILASFEAWSRTGGAVLVADLGTAWTLDLVTEQGRFLGGAIGAGLGLQTAALLEACPHLVAPPPLRKRPEGPGRDTAQAVGHGTAVALAAALEGVAALYRGSAPGAVLWLTGADAAQVEPHFTTPVRSAEHLVLAGLARLASGR